ncbi:MAG: single-stranded-DNA-specific exonuclease RecJ [Anaerolineae bacterium]|nr:single-stranded-DNA-specific exonuclease RecJ [Anaerolineae bacterium]
MKRPNTLWQVAAHASREFYQALPELHPLLAQVLWARGNKTVEQARAFITPTPIENAAQSLVDLDKAVDRILQALGANESIAIYGDYDCDGVTASALLMMVLRQLGATVQVYIPDRFEEGYGLNATALDKLKARGVNLVITVDCGARAVSEAEHAREIGLDLIITDHHDLEHALPNALAVINPKRPDCSYEFKQLAGVGVAFRLAQALLAKAERTTAMLDFAANDLLDLVAIGTIADVMPLVGENRSLVQAGLRALNAHPRLGVAALTKAARLRGGHVSAGQIGFQLAPRLNAAGRLDTALNAYDLLTTDNEAWASDLAATLSSRNEQRQQITAAVVRAAEKQLSQHEVEWPLSFASSSDFNAGVIGLAAARLVERHMRPAVVVTITGEEARGSCRSVNGFHMTDALDTCKDLLLRHGGHAAAAGFTTRTTSLGELQQRLCEIAQTQRPEQGWAKIIHADAEINLHKLTPQSHEAMQLLEPHGHGNPRPVFVARQIEVRSARRIGRAEEDAPPEGGAGPHLKLSLKDARGGNWDAIGWRMGERLNEVTPSSKIDVAFHLDINEWNGERRLQLVLEDMQA